MLVVYFFIQSCLILSHQDQPLLIIAISHNPSLFKIYQDSPPPTKKKTPRKYFLNSDLKSQRPHSFPLPLSVFLQICNALEKWRHSEKIRVRIPIMVQINVGPLLSRWTQKTFMNVHKDLIAQNEMKLFYWHFNSSYQIEIQHYFLSYGMDGNHSFLSLILNNPFLLTFYANLYFTNKIT